MPFDLVTWATRYGVPWEAVVALRQGFGMETDPNSREAQSEAGVLVNVRLEASAAGHRLWRNNSGALQDESGRWVRYGLCNDSAKLNEQIKSADLIGIRRRLIGPSDVGTVIGQFMSRECKPAGWRYSGQGREPAQLRWAEAVTALGGDACFATGAGTI